MSDNSSPKIIVTKDGPYVVTGSVPLAVNTIEPTPEGAADAWRQGSQFPDQDKYALCRCGHSKHAPYCDGTHAAINFDGTETASRLPFNEQKELFDGPSLVLEDARPFCSAARFCDAGKDIWEGIGETDETAMREHVLYQATHCPSGRLVVRDKATGEAVEPELELSINVVEDPGEQCSGPLWVRGGIPVVSQDGTPYEVRNRVTLCRCGASKNKPFCDGSHMEVKYQDGLAPGSEAM